MVEKRPHEAGPAGGAQQNGDAAKKPKLSLEALEKAKRALQLQKELQEKLKQKLPQLQKASAAGAAAAAAAPSVVLPPPPAGPPSAAAIAASVAHHAAAAAAAAAAAGGAQLVLQPPPGQAAAQPAEPPAKSFYDPRMGSGALRKLSRKPRLGFDFVEEGEFVRQAEAHRLKARYGRDAAPPPRGPIGPSAGAGDANQVPLGVRPSSREVTPGVIEEEEEAVDDVPDVEWWDKGLLASGSYEADVPADPSAPVAIKESKITLYVEHPVPIQPPAEAPPPPPQPLKLTKREMKKLRTQRRQAREKEKQDLIRQGLLEPPKPKVKLSNLYRVLGEQAVLDPTAIELETRKQMAERRAAHEDRNLANSLTPDERRDKKLRKMFDNTGLEVITSVYKVLNMDNTQNKYKVDINAKENHMTGVLLLTPEFSLVVVEGCNKATKRYMKLMLRRIDWDAPPTRKPGAGAGADGGAAEDEEEEEERPPNRCDLVWQGLVKEAAFQGFKVEECRTIEHAQQVLSQRKVPHYWDAAKSFVPGESIAMELD